MTYTADAENRRMRGKVRFWRFIAVIAVVGAAVALLVGGDAVGFSRSHIARLSIDGMIVQDEERSRALEALTERGARALVVHINSPGGTVVGGEDLYRALRRVGEKIPVVTVMGTLATSAGYMAALPGERVFARESTLTGSIGVLVQTTDITGLLERIGITAEAIKSSPLKAQPSPLEPLTPQGRQAIQEVIADMYDFFVGLVVERRPLTLDQVRPLADGRIYTGRQALAVGLIDEIGGEVAAIAWLAATHGLDAGLPVVDVKIERKTGLIARIFNQFSGKSLISNALTLDGVVSLWHPELQ